MNPVPPKNPGWPRTPTAAAISGVGTSLLCVAFSTPHPHTHTHYSTGLTCTPLPLPCESFARWEPGRPGGGWGGDPPGRGGAGPLAWHTCGHACCTKVTPQVPAQQCQLHTPTHLDCQPHLVNVHLLVTGQHRHLTPHRTRAQHKRCQHTRSHTSSHACQATTQPP